MLADHIAMRSKLVVAGPANLDVSLSRHRSPSKLPRIGELDFSSVEIDPPHPQFPPHGSSASFVVQPEGWRTARLAVIVRLNPVVEHST